MANNERTRANAQAALDAYVLGSDPNGSNGEETNIADLIADLAHLADAKGMSGEQAINTAQAHYACEVGEAEDV